MICAPHWTTYLSALLVPVVAVLGVAIAYRQWRTAQNKLKLDLFEKRFAVYDAVRQLIGSIMTSGVVRTEDLYMALAKTREAKWLLSADIDVYLNKDLYRKLVKLQSLDVELKELPVGEKRSANVEAQRVLKDWISDQNDVLDEKFSSFLSLGH